MKRRKEEVERGKVIRDTRKERLRDREVKVRKKGKRREGGKEGRRRREEKKRGSVRTCFSANPR